MAGCPDSLACGEKILNKDSIDCIHVGIKIDKKVDKIVSDTDYKATNAITLLYQGTPLVIGSMTGESFGWLPKGRSLFRDKRIPRS